MNRIEIQAKDPLAHSVVVGFDRQIGTFFVQVFDRPACDHNRGLDCLLERTQEGDPQWSRLHAAYEDCEIVYWRGSTVQEIENVSRLVELVRPYAEIPQHVVEQIQRDQDTAPTLTQWQRETRQLLATLVAH